MVLQLDRDDDEAEQYIRLTIEQRNARKLRRILRRMNGAFREAFPEDFDPNEAAQLAQLAWRRVDKQPLHGAIRDTVQDGVDLGVNTGMDQLETIGLSVNFDLVHEEARDWARQYSGQLITQIDATTERQVQRAVAQWIETEEGTLPQLTDLIRSLDPTFSQRRAEMIATTESTRAYAEGTRQTYIESGVTQYMKWRTAHDEKVCPICGPLHERITGVRGHFHGALPDEIAERTKFFEIPPAHPNCRCWLVPVVMEPS